MWRASVLTLFPDMFPGPLSVSLAGKALDAKIWSLDVCDIKAHGIGPHLKVDDRPAGGGPSMPCRLRTIPGPLSI
jgi:tRNA (guanine37-N1)-methyltransferase